MANYYWNKYNTSFKYPMSQDQNYGRSYEGKGTDTTLVAWIASALSGNNIVFNDNYLYGKAYFDGRTSYTFDNPTLATWSNVVNGIYYIKTLNAGTYCLQVTVVDSNYYLTIYTVKWIEEEYNKIYLQGSLVQSNIVANESAYTNNARHTDGFWYVRGAAVNTAPTTPGAFKQPTGALEIGDSKAVTWGASTDAEGNLSRYILEVSINSGSWTQIGTPTSASFTYTVPTCTNIQFRVKAVDGAGLESAYTTSISFAVTKPKYYYSKYNTIATPIYGETGVSKGKISMGDAGQNKTLADMIRTFGFHGNLDCWLEVANKHTGSYEGYTKVLNASDMSNRIAYCVEVWLFSTVNFISGNTCYRYTFTKELVGNTTEYMVSLSIYTLSLTQTNYTKGSLINTGVIAEDGIYPNDGRYPADGFWYVKGSRVNDSIAPPGAFTTPVSGTLIKPGQQVTFTWGASTAQNIADYEVYLRYNEDEVWYQQQNGVSTSRLYTDPNDKSKKTVQFRVRAKNSSNVFSDYVYSDVFVIEHNKVPTLTLNTENNKTLYENDTFLIDGSAIDTDNGNIVNIKYSLDGGTVRAIKTDISNGSTPIPFTKQLTFKDGKLYDGETAITDKLAEGSAHQLKVFAEDDQGGKSAEQTRSFFVVPNRAPAITINPIEKPTGVIDSDKFTVSGTCSDPDGNDVIVSHKINTSLATEIYRGKGGDWTFDVAFSSLKVGENIIIVEVIDSHNFKTSKTIKLNKDKVETPILNSVARYKIVPPTGNAKGVLLWIRKDKDLDITAEISMNEVGVQEQYVELPLTNSAPIDSFITEDQFSFEASEAKENIIVKFNLSRESADVGDSITLISGVLS